MAGSSREEDRAVAKAARSAMARSPLDISELNVSCNNGYVELIGKVRAPRGASGTVNMRKEFEVLKTIVRSVRGVRDIDANRVLIFD